MFSDFESFWWQMPAGDSTGDRATQGESLTCKSLADKEGSGASWEVQPVVGSLQEWAMQREQSPNRGSAGLKSPRVLYSSPRSSRSGDKATASPRQHQPFSGAPQPSLIKSLGLDRPTLNVSSCAPLAYGSPRASLREPQHTPVGATPHSLLAGKRHPRTLPSPTPSPNKDELRPRTPTALKPGASPRHEMYTEIEAEV